MKKDDLSLLIDATGQYCYLYLILGNTIIAKSKHENQNNLSYSLALYIRRLCIKKTFSINDINKIYLVYGPGKFSAMRISSVATKIISYLNNAKIFILDKLKYLSVDNCYCIVKSDGKKSFAIEYRNGYEQDSPRLIDDQYINEFIKDKSLKIIYDNDNEYNVINKLKDFKEVDNEFLLEYWKPAC